MTTIFMFCALIGGVVLVFQFVMTLVGFGDMDVVDDVPDLDALDAGDLDIGDPHGSSSVFGVLSFRTVIAAIAFFGIGGMAANSADVSLPLQLIIASVCGVGALYAVYYLMRSVYGLGQSGTINISNTVGRTGTVYIPIPAGQSGPGKVQVKVQDRLEEFAAITAAEEKLTTGAKVVVVGVVSSNTLEVQPLHETAEAAV